MSRILGAGLPLPALPQPDDLHSLVRVLAGLPLQAVKPLTEAGIESLVVGQDVVRVVLS
jgi:hypothetical protein